MAGPVFPTMKIELEQLTHALQSGQASLNHGSAAYTFQHILHPDGDYLYFIGLGAGGLDVMDFNIVDVSDRDNPSFVGELAALSGVFGLFGRMGMVFDSTDRYLYVTDGDVSMYTIDCLDPSAPTLAHTLTVSDGGTASTLGIHILNRIGNFLYLLAVGDAQCQKISISTPSAPSVTSTINISSITTGISNDSWVSVTPDGEYLMYTMNGLTFGLGFVTLSSFAFHSVLSLPKFGSPSGPNIFPVGAPLFLPSYDSTKLWLTAAYNSSGIRHTFWLILEASGGAIWPNAVVISDPVQGSGAGYITPTTEIAIQPTYALLFPTAPADDELEVTIFPTDQYNFIEVTVWSVRYNFKPYIKRRYKIDGFYNVFSWNIAPDNARISVGVGVHGVSLLATTLIFQPDADLVTSSGWTDITSYVTQTEDIQISYGISGTGPDNRIASPGMMSFRLINSDPVGLFSPDHASRMDGFELGAPVRLTLNGVRKFAGRISKISPVTGTNNQKMTAVECADVVKSLSRIHARGVPVRIDTTSGLAMKELLDLPEITAVVGLAIDDTTDLLEYVFDAIREETTFLSGEAQRIAQTELGFLFHVYRNYGLSANLVKNYSFEDDFDHWEDISTGTGSATITTADHITGEKAVLLDGAGASDVAEIATDLDDLIEVKSGGLYIAEVHLSDETGTSFGAQALIQNVDTGKWLDENGSWSASKTYWKFQGGTTSLTYSSIVFTIEDAVTVGSRTCRLRLHLRNGTGLGMAEDYKISPLDGVIRFESRDNRHNSPIYGPVMTGNKIRSLVVDHADDNIFNVVQARLNPRVSESAASVLFELAGSPEIQPGESVSFTASYKRRGDDFQVAPRVSRTGGIDMQTPIAATDYTFNTIRDGTGADITSSLIVAVLFGGTGAEVVLTNVSSSIGYVTKFQLRGKAILAFEPYIIRREDTLSKFQHGPSDITFDVPYVGDRALGEQLTGRVLDVYKDARTFHRALTFFPNHSQELMSAFIDKDIGSKVVVEDVMLGQIWDTGTWQLGVAGKSELNDTAKLGQSALVYVIHGIRFRIGENKIIECTWMMMPSDLF